MEYEALLKRSERYTGNLRVKNIQRLDALKNSVLSVSLKELIKYLPSEHSFSPGDDSQWNIHTQYYSNGFNACRFLLLSYLEKMKQDLEERHG